LFIQKEENPTICKIMEYPGKYKAISTIADTEKQILQDFEDV
jgi:translation initiation factor IF-3